MREPINTWTHLLGMILAFLGLIALCIRSIVSGNYLSLVGSLIFGLSMILLYGASSLYHGYKGKNSVILKLRKLDHSMIFVLIAGTYTPICLLVLKGLTGTILLVSIWSLALLGIISKIMFIHMPRKLSAGLYVFMGWVSLLVIYPLFNALPTIAFVYLVLGGVLYTVGSVFYAKKPTKMQIGNWGFHEIFHLFILAGSLAHFALIYNYVI